MRCEMSENAYYSTAIIVYSYWIVFRGKRILFKHLKNDQEIATNFLGIHAV